MNLKNDIYYQKEYISIYLKEGESIFEFEYKEGENWFYQITIKRPILKVGSVELGKIYYDLETAYGYGGYLCNTDNQDFIEKAWGAYKKKCEEENIIAEFVRYHPLNHIHQFIHHDFLIEDRHIVYVDLSLSKEERWKNYSSKVRNILRKCDKNLKFLKSNSIEAFIKLYEETMRKNNANEFYFFDRDYFNRLGKIQSFELYEVRDDQDNILSTSFFNFSEDYAHYHLSANNYKVNNQNSNYFILENAIEIAKAKRCKRFLLGGGRTSAENDSLLRFKRKFSSGNMGFFIAGNIFNKEIYKELISIWEQQNPENTISYFLKYRL